MQKRDGAKPSLFYSTLRQILDPGALFNHEVAHHALDQVGGGAQKVQRNDRDRCKAAEDESHRHAAHPHEAAVKQECHKGLTTGTEGEVGCIAVSVKGHEDCCHTDQLSGNNANGIRGVVNLREHAGHRHHQSAKQEAGCH